MDEAGVKTLPAANTRLSVVVVIFAGRPYLDRCLTSLTRQAERLEGVEIIVPLDDRLATRDELDGLFPSVRFPRLSGIKTFAQLRAAGVHEAGGPLIAITEDQCTPASDWCTVLLEEHESEWAAVGGAVDKGYPEGSDKDTALNWAIYLSDFGRYLNPVPAGPSGYLTDVNVSYKRSALQEIASLFEEEFHETTVNWALMERGHTLHLSPGVIVYQQRNLTVSEALSERLQFGRLFAATRVAATGPARRLVYAAFSVLLPALLVLRVTRNVFGKRRHLGPYVRALPYVTMLAVAWSIGELCGYVTGRPGKTLSA
jgi:hypothetical protein